MSWTIKKSGPGNGLWCVTYDGNQFVAVGNKGAILTSKADITGAAMQPGFSRSSPHRINICFGNNRGFAAFPYSTAAGRVNVGLFTIAGKMIFSYTAGVDNGTLNIPAPEFPKGVYILSVGDGVHPSLSAPFVLVR
jgi:hypothetical protein